MTRPSRLHLPIIVSLTLGITLVGVSIGGAAEAAEHPGSAEASTSLLAESVGIDATPPAPAEPWIDHRMLFEDLCITVAATSEITGSFSFSGGVEAQSCFGNCHCQGCECSSGCSLEECSSGCEECFKQIDPGGC